MLFEHGDDESQHGNRHNDNERRRNQQQESSQLFQVNKAKKTNKFRIYKFNNNWYFFLLDVQREVDRRETKTHPFAFFCFVFFVSLRLLIGFW